ncbi:MAG: YeeE/YedE family protein [Kofleriaceae bacterium]|nr:YeeE/YedE family protein [Kofleriaceae bacterium]MCB9574318.1 YeeE/YedE family protein [Kofleriaceae bacterium]
MQSSYLLSLGGGAMIGAAASLLLLGNGRVAGISGIVGALLQRDTSDRDWRFAFVIGLVVAGVIAAIATPGRLGGSVVSLPIVAIAGVVVGFGTRLGSGCTSGHGVCGISRLSMRSMIATGTFMATGAATVALVGHLGGGS